jgi:hypothetical protein
MAEYVHTVTLPTRAKIYNEAYGIPEDITLRAISTKEEKVLYGSSGDKALDRVIKACIVEPKAINLDHLVAADKHYLLMQLRIHTYGADYHVEYKCPNCGETHEYEVDLSEQPVHELAEDFEEPIKFKLPVNGDELTVKMLRGTDLEEIEKRAKRLKKGAKAIDGDITYILRMARYIQTINGEEMGDVERQGYVESLHGKDSAYFWHQINKIKLGYDPEVEETCKGCQEDITFILPMTVEFFRPRFDD